MLGVGGQSPVKTGEVCKIWLQVKPEYADASEQNRSSKRSGKRYWPNSRPINRLKMGGLVVSKNQHTRRVKPES